MDVRHWFKSETWQLDSRLWLLINATFASYFAFLISTPVTLIAIACLVAALGYAHLQDGRTIAVMPIPDWLTLGGLLVAYIAVSIFWSADPSTTGKTALLIAGLLAATHIGILLIVCCPAIWLEHMTRTLLIALSVALLYFIIEDLTDLAIQKALIWPFRAVRFNSGVWFDHSTVLDLSKNSIKWRMPPLGFLLWPALLICTLQLKDLKILAVRSVQASLVGAAAWMMWYSNHRTSVAALIAATLVFALATWRPTLVRRSLGGLWIASFVVIIPVVLTLFSLNLHKDPRFANKLDARFIIWAHTAEQVKKHPLRGVGAAATKLINTQNVEVAKSATPADFVYLWSTGPHAHNAFLQSWFELGALGTMLLAAFGLHVLNLTALAPLATQPYLQAAFAAVAVTGSASFGLFEPWFMGTFSMCALSCIMAVTYYRRLHTSG
jgi:O-antigen ligase